jgi:Tfp pilus assembly protein PilO
MFISSRTAILFTVWILSCWQPLMLVASLTMTSWLLSSMTLIMSEMVEEEEEEEKEEATKKERKKERKKDVVALSDSNNAQVVALKREGGFTLDR